MRKKSGQVAMEYLILLGVLVIIALTSFRTLVPGAQQETNKAFDSGVGRIVGNAPITSATGPWP